MDPLSIMLASAAILYIVSVIARGVEMFVNYRNRNRVQIIPTTI